MAYHNQCSLCRLHHRELLDATHIIGDREEIRKDILAETDGPMLKCGIQFLENEKLILKK